MLEEVRLLSNLETPTSKLIQIMLVGQPELKEVLARPELRQLRQRIALRHHLRPFDEKETAEYVQGRLEKAGFTGRPIFKKSAIKELHTVTGGTPRLINSVCDSALLLGYSRQQAQLGGPEIREVALDLELGDGGAALAPDANDNQGARPRRKGFLGFFR